MVRHFSMPVALVASLVCIHMSWARVINVPAEYATIQAGIDEAVNGDTVLVAPGEYAADSVVIHNKNILLTSAEGPSVTRINGRVFIRGEGIDTTCVLRGFRIDGDSVGGWPENLVFMEYSSPIIWGNTIENNDNSFAGAGICAFESGMIIRENIIRFNWSCAVGGGIYALNQDTAQHRQVIIEGNVISGNRTGYCIGDQGDCAGISMSARGVIRFNLIDGNWAANAFYSQGGGVCAGASHTKIYNNTIVGNIALSPLNRGRGGGLASGSWQSDGDGFIKNNIIAFNYGGGAYYSMRDSTSYINWDYNLVFGNDSIDYIGLDPGTNDIQANPLFTGTYRLQPNSPCIDAGDPTFPLDPDSTRADIGAYYFDQAVGIDEPGPSGPYSFSLAQNYPNPFNAQTVISYSLDREATVSLLVYSITGQLVRSLVSGEVQGAGAHRYTWDGTDSPGEAVTTGIYFYELHVGDYKESKAMILVK